MGTNIRALVTIHRWGSAPTDSYQGLLCAAAVVFSELRIATRCNIMSLAGLLAAALNPITRKIMQYLISLFHSTSSGVPHDAVVTGGLILICELEL